MPVVARTTDSTACPLHERGRISHGLADVLICHKPVARKGDPVKCKDGSHDVIVEGSASVWIGGKPVAFKGHRTSHGGKITSGCPTVFIGLGLRNICALRAAADRAAFIRGMVQMGGAPFGNPGDSGVL